MKNELWLAVHAVFHSLEKLGKNFSQKTVETAALSYNLEDSSEPQHLKELVQARKELRSLLMHLKSVLAEHLSEREVYMSLFPIVVYIDETVQTEVFQVSEKQWALLQKELFDIEDGGVLFYDTLDDALRHPETLPFVLELFYLCMKSGFKGKYAENPARLNSYLEMLKNRIPTTEIDFMALDAELPKLEHGCSTRWYYLAAIILAGACYGAFLYVGSLTGEQIKNNSTQLAP